MRKNLLNYNLSQKGVVQLLPLLLIIIIVIGVAYLLLGKSFNPGNLMNNQSKTMKQLASYYSLTVTGVTDASKIPTGPSGGSLFVPEIGNCQINLIEGDFKVEDNNCTDGVASFSLPANSSGENGVTTFAVFAKTADNKLASSTDCKKDSTGTFCPIQSMVVVRSQDSSYSSDVSKLLENVYSDVKGTGTAQRYFLFDDSLKDVFWTADSKGNKMVQLRFYPQSPQTLQQVDQQN